MGQWEYLGDYTGGSYYWNCECGFAVKTGKNELQEVTDKNFIWFLKLELCDLENIVESEIEKHKIPEDVKYIRAEKSY
ncbi:MAG: hypothetical protein NTV63_05310 [Candidatus Woesearchaeota archaeon]|nr:hypothetical protein [Candidatus Woesearchaeota archaeon]